MFLPRNTIIVICHLIGNESFLACCILNFHYNASPIMTGDVLSRYFDAKVRFKSGVYVDGEGRRLPPLYSSYVI